MLKMSNAKKVITEYVISSVVIINFEIKLWVIFGAWRVYIYIYIPVGKGGWAARAYCSWAKLSDHEVEGVIDILFIRCQGKRRFNYNFKKEASLFLMNESKYVYDVIIILYTRLITSSIYAVKTEEEMDC